MGAGAISGGASLWRPATCRPSVNDPVDLFVTHFQRPSLRDIPPQYRVNMIYCVCCMPWFCSYRIGFSADKVQKKAQIFQCNPCLFFFRAGSPGAGTHLGPPRGDRPGPLPLCGLQVSGRGPGRPGKACCHTTPWGESDYAVRRPAGLSVSTGRLGVFCWPQRWRYALGQGPLYPFLVVWGVGWGARGGRMDGLDLFNDDTSPSGHISRPTQVNVSQSCFNSLNKSLKSDHIVQVLGLVEVNKLHHIR